VGIRLVDLLFHSPFLFCADSYHHAPVKEIKYAGQPEPGILCEPIFESCRLLPTPRQAVDRSGFVTR